MIFMLRLFKRKSVLSKTILPKTIVERQITVAKKSNVAISPTITKNKIYEGGRLNDVKRKLIYQINKLHKKQKTYGLTKREKTLLAEYVAQLERVGATREGTKRMFVED